MLVPLTSAVAPDNRSTPSCSSLAELVRLRGGIPRCKTVTRHDPVDVVFFAFIEEADGVRPPGFFGHMDGTGRLVGSSLPRLKRSGLRCR
jgi:hypothetical protein